MFEKEFAILGIEKTRDENAVRDAYRAKLAVTNPEDKPEEFKQLRNAYEQAMVYVKNGEEEPEEDSVVYTQGLTNNSVIDWMCHVIDLTGNPKMRSNVEEWKKLLAEPACNDFDTSTEAGLALFHYLMDHYYMNSAIYRLIDEKFEIVGNENEWREQLPGGFVDYMISKVKDVDNETDYAVEWFEGENGADYDEFVRMIETCGQQLWGNDLDGAETSLAEMKTKNIRHPFYQLNQIRYELMRYPERRKEEPRRSEILEEMNKLLADYPTSRRIPLECGEMFWWCGEKEKAEEVYKELETRDSHFLIEKYRGWYAFEKGDIIEAEKRFNKVADTEETEMNDLLKLVDEEFIEPYFGKELPQDAKTLELYLYACLRREKAEEVMRAKECTTFSEVEYKGHILYRYYKDKKMMKEADEALLIWQADFKERTDKEGRESYATSLLRYATNCFDMLKENYDEERGEMGIRAAKEARMLYTELDPKYEISCDYEIACLMVEMHRYAEANDFIDKLLEKSPNFMQLVAKKQECCVGLRRAQDVVDLYHRGVDLIGDEPISDILKEDYTHLFERAAEVFLAFSQYEDVKSVLEDANRHNVDSNCLVSYAAALERRLGEQSRDYKGALEKVEEAEKKLRENNGEKDLAECLFNKALLLNDIDEDHPEPAIKAIDEAIGFCPECMKYHYAKARFYHEAENHTEALKSYMRVYKTDGYSFNLNLNIAYCYNSMRSFEDAIRYSEEIKEDIQKEDTPREDKEEYYRLMSDIYYRRMKSNPDRDDPKMVVQFEQLLLGVLEGDAKNDAGIYSRLTDAYLQMGDVNKAYDAVQKAVEIDGENVYLLWQMSEVFKKKEEYGKSCSYLEKAYENARPERQSVYCELAFGASRRLEDTKRVIYWGEKLLQYSDEFKKRAIDELISYCEHKKEFDRALHYIEQKKKFGFYEDEYIYESNRLDALYCKYRDKGLKKRKLVKEREALLNRMLRSGNKDAIREYFSYGVEFVYYFDDPKKALVYLKEGAKLLNKDNFMEYNDYLTKLILLLRDLGMDYSEYEKQYENLLMLRYGGENCDEAIRKSLEKVNNTLPRAVSFALFYAGVQKPEKAAALLEETAKNELCEHCCYRYCTEQYASYGLLLETEDKLDEALSRYYAVLKAFSEDDFSLWRIREIMKKKQSK